MAGLLDGLLCAPQESNLLSSPCRGDVFPVDQARVSFVAADGIEPSRPSL